MQQRQVQPTPIPTPVVAVVLAPAMFYTAVGARCRSIAPTQTMIEQLTARLQLDIRLSIWDQNARAITLV